MQNIHKYPLYYVVLFFAWWEERNVLLFAWWEERKGDDSEDGDTLKTIQIFLKEGWITSISISLFFFFFSSCAMRGSDLK